MREWRVGNGSSSAWMTPRVWDVATGLSAGPTVGRNRSLCGAVYDTAMSPVGRRRSSGVGCGDCQEWSFPGHDSFQAAVAPDGRSFLVGGVDGVVRIYDAATGVERGRLALGIGRIQSLSIAAGGSVAAACGDAAAGRRLGRGALTGAARRQPAGVGASTGGLTTRRSRAAIK